MAGIKISDLPARTSVDDTMTLAVDTGTNTYKITVGDYNHSATETARQYANQSAQSASDSAASALDAQHSLNQTIVVAGNAATSATNAGISETNAANSATNAATSATKAADSEAWAVGTRSGDPVSPSDPQYLNYAKYWAEQAAAVAHVNPMDNNTMGIGKPDGQTAEATNGTFSAIGTTIVATVDSGATPFSASWLKYNNETIVPDSRKQYRVEYDGETGLWYWTGTAYEKIAGSGEQAEIDELQTKTSNIATIETTATASKAYPVGRQFIYNGRLYKATSAIAQGDTIVVGGNCALSSNITDQINNENIYSTTEQVVGTWIDGKPVYEKTIDTGAVTPQSIKEVAHNISNIGQVCSINGVIRFNDNGAISDYTMPYINDQLVNAINVSVTSTYVRILARNMDDVRFTSSYVTIRYTKTTD